MSFPSMDAASGHLIPARHRLLIYGAVWVLAAMAIQVFLRPEGLTETDLTPVQQRVWWPLYTPLMVVVGLAQALTWPDFPQETAGVAAGVGLLLHAIVALTRGRRGSFAVLTIAQVLLLAVAVACFVGQSQLPTGG